MRKYIDLTSWILLFFFAPFTVLILLSQNSLPGDLFYPVKRGLENIILVAASVNPSSKVAFRTGLTQTRFTEAQRLLVTKADTTAYSDFVAEVSSAQQDLTKVQSTPDKIENSDKLLAKIEEYQTQLIQVQSQVQVAQGLPAQQNPSQPIQPTNVPVPIQPTNSPAPNQPIQTNQPVQTNRPSQTAVPASQQPQPVVTAPPAAVPVNVPTPAPLAPSVTNTIANNPQKAEQVKEKIKDTQENLEKIKEKIQKEKEDAQAEEKAKEEQKKLREELNSQKENEPTATPRNK